MLERLGGRRALWLGAATLSASLAVLGLAPATWPAIGLSALLFGAAYNALVAIQSIWSVRVFSARPSAGLGAVMFMLGMGLMIGPAVAGVVAARLGFPAAFVGAAALVASVGLLSPREDLRLAESGRVASPAGGGP